MSLISFLKNTNLYIFTFLTMTEINQDLIKNREEIYETFRQDQENEDLARIRGEVEEHVQLLLNF